MLRCRASILILCEESLGKHELAGRPGGRAGRAGRPGSGNPGRLGQILDLLLFGHRPNSYTFFGALSAPEFFISFLLICCYFGVTFFSGLWRRFWGLSWPFSESPYKTVVKGGLESLWRQFGACFPEGKKCKKTVKKTVRYNIFRVRQKKVPNKSRI